MPRDRNYFDRKDTLHGKLPKVFHTKTEGQRNSQVEKGYADTTEAQSNTDISPTTVPTPALLHPKQPWHNHAAASYGFKGSEERHFLPIFPR